MSEVVAIKERLFKDQPWIALASKEAAKSTYQHKIGAVVVKGGSVLSKGFNKIRHRKIGLRFTKWPVSLHAERDALTKIKKEDIVGCSIYLYREFKSGMPASAEPCEMCAWMLYELGVKEVIHTVAEEPYYRRVRL